MNAASRRLIRRATRRPLTIEARRRRVLDAMHALAACDQDWPLERRGLAELGEALALLDYVIRQLNEQEPQPMFKPPVPAVDSPPVKVGQTRTDSDIGRIHVTAAVAGGRFVVTYAAQPHETSVLSPDVIRAYYPHVSREAS